MTRPIEDSLRAAGIELIATAELAALRADRERMDYLAELIPAGGTVYYDHQNKWFVAVDCNDHTLGRGMTLNIAIDAARGCEMSKLTVGESTPLTVGPVIGREYGRLEVKPGYSLVKNEELAELRSTVEDLDWLLNYLNTYVQEEALADFWKVASEFCEGADECTDPMVCGQQAIRQMRGAK